MILYLEYPNLDLTQLSQQLPGEYALLESSASSYLACLSDCTVRADHLSSIIDPIMAWEEYAEQFKRMSCENSDLLHALGISFTGGWVGYWSYELYKYLESSIPVATHELPLLYMVHFSGVFAWSKHRPESIFLIARDKIILQQLQDIYSRLCDPRRGRLPCRPLITCRPSIPCRPSIWKAIHLVSNFSEAEYIKIVEKALDYLRDGDIFQVNLSQCFSGILPENINYLELYTKLRDSVPTNYNSWLKFGDTQIISASPEQFIKINQQHIITMPIKGTAARGETAKQDLELASTLLQCSKNRSENIMIVDLWRNELSKICTPNSVQVEKLCSLESYANVHHLVSTITGQLKQCPGTNTSIQALRSCFPGGSVTGAPKVRAMQIIAELETMPRGPYCGCFGYLDDTGNAEFAITIRTMVINKRAISVHGGGGVILNSDPELEYMESIQKIKPFISLLGE